MIHPKGVIARPEFSHLRFASWNTLRRGVGNVEEVVRGLKHHLGVSVVALQEVDYWRACSGRTMHGFEFFMSDANGPYSDCGFLLPLAMTSSIRAIHFGTYWAGIMALDTLHFVSLAGSWGTGWSMPCSL